ncbi:hypothetical protein NE237_021349 [Protea cynaroides]|uniref:Uncharacterized protein n=1 Tax=Protea cynaroides TaxID=273540 RepID=A0A9Q0H8Y1_9MAGN|nr:hypothetical protein NE237_021349 [Protea cynaroides]
MICQFIYLFTSIFIHQNKAAFQMIILTLTLPNYLTQFSMTIPEGQKKVKKLHITSNHQPDDDQQLVRSSDFDGNEYLSRSNTADWVISIKQKLDRVSPFVTCSWLDHCIFEVPKHLREIDPKAYDPQLVSIGPFHRGKASLQPKEKHKWRLLRHLLDRTGHTVELYLEAMADLEEKTRSCYSVSLDHIESREFVEMMLLDACFIIELINASVKGFIHGGFSWGDPIFTTRGFLPCVQRDLLMLENQLPLFVLDRLYALTCDPEDHDSVSQLAVQFFDSVIPGCHNLELELMKINEPGLHLLQVIRQCLLPTKSAFLSIGCDPEIKQQPQALMHCVTALRTSGVKLQKKVTDKFLDIEFKKGILYIPKLVIHDSTKAIFLNLMAYEQCYPHCSNDVTSYVTFMDGLINTSRDVGYLRFEGIIDHGLGSDEEVATLFNKICRQFVFDINDCYLSALSIEVNRYYDYKWNTWRALLKHDYVSNPWAIVSLLAAIFLIGLTLTQTLYSVLAYYIPPP